MNDYALMSMGPSDPQQFPLPTPDSAGIPKAVEGEMLIAPYNDLETTTAIIERHHDELGGVIVEPFQRLIPPKPGFLQGLREITQQYEIPLIFDEVVTGFRFAYGGGQEYYGVTPDLCSLGKVVAGGYPLSAVAGREELMAQFNANATQPGEHLPMVGTLSGNPVAAVAGLTTLNILKREGTYEKLFATGRRLKGELQRLLDEAELPARVVGEPPLFDVLFTTDEVTDYRSTLRADKSLFSEFNRLMQERGLLKGTSKFYVSVAHTEEDVQQTIDAMASAIAELRG
jgi:glutamate-1-semialdehyde 2,1-aminomutase